jgi:hypothetical protein
MTIRPVAARILIALVVVNAAAGVTALVVSSDKQIGSFEGHIFLTTLAASMAAFTILPCLLSYERGLAKPLAGLGIAASLVTLGVLVTLIWTDNPPDDLWSSTVSAAAVSLGLALVNLLTLATLPRSNEWVRLAAYALTALPPPRSSPSSGMTIPATQGFASSRPLPSCSRLPECWHPSCNAWRETRLMPVNRQSATVPTAAAGLSARGRRPIATPVAPASASGLSKIGLLTDS